MSYQRAPAIRYVPCIQTGEFAVVLTVATVLIASSAVLVAIVI